MHCSQHRRTGLALTHIYRVTRPWRRALTNGSDVKVHISAMSFVCCSLTCVCVWFCRCGWMWESVRRSQQTCLRRRGSRASSGPPEKKRWWVNREMWPFLKRENWRGKILPPRPTPPLLFWPQFHLCPTIYLCFLCKLSFFLSIVCRWFAFWFLIFIIIQYIHEHIYLCVFYCHCLFAPLCHLIDLNRSYLNKLISVIC